MWIRDLASNTTQNLSVEGHWCKPVTGSEKLAIEACKLQSTDGGVPRSTSWIMSWSRQEAIRQRRALMNPTSMTFDRKILRGVRCQVLYSHHVNCTAVPWGSLSLSVIPLALVNGLHHWPVIKRCLSMFDFSAILTWIDLYLEWRSNEFEDPGSSFIHPGCDIYSGNIKTFDMYIIAADDHPTQRMIISAENYQSTIRRSSVLCTKMYL